MHPLTQFEVIRQEQARVEREARRRHHLPPTECRRLPSLHFSIPIRRRRNVVASGRGC